MKRTLDRMLVIMLILIPLIEATICGCYLMDEYREMLERLEEFEQTEFASVRHPELVRPMTDYEEVWQQMLEAEGQQ